MRPGEEVEVMANGEAVVNNIMSRQVIEEEEEEEEDVNEVVVAHASLKRVTRPTAPLCLSLQSILLQRRRRSSCPP